MDDRRLGHAIRARRHRRGWRIVDLAAAAGVEASICSLLEGGHVDRLTVRAARAIAAAVDLPLGWDIGWQRQEIDRLLDADHSAIAAHWTSRLESWGWIVRSEVSFNWYGDRGRIDLLAYHPGHRILLVIEIKTAIVDAQALLGALDVKTRNAPFVARGLGWSPSTVPALVVSEGTTARRHVEALAPLFSRFMLRGTLLGRGCATRQARQRDGSPSRSCHPPIVSMLGEQAGVECVLERGLHAQSRPQQPPPGPIAPPNTDTVDARQLWPTAHTARTQRP